MIAEAGMVKATAGGIGGAGLSWLAPRGRGAGRG
jgi:hypothetical protein